MKEDLELVEKIRHTQKFTRLRVKVGRYMPVFRPIDSALYTIAGMMK